MNESWGVTITVTPFSLAKVMMFSHGVWEPVTIINDTFLSINATWASSLSPTIAISPAFIWSTMLFGSIAETTILPGNVFKFSFI